MDVNELERLDGRERSLRKFRPLVRRKRVCSMKKLRRSANKSNHVEVTNYKKPFLYTSRIKTFIKACLHWFQLVLELFNQQT